MSAIIWAGGALLAAAAILWAVARYVMPARPEPAMGEGVPATDLQRAARWSLILGLLPTLATVLIVAVAGPEKTLSDASLRISVFILAVVALVVGGSGAWWVVRSAARGQAVLDERDRAILERAPVVQSLATLLVLAVWTVVLTERFHAAGSVPLAFLQLVFWSCVLVNLLGLPAGVLMGYRRG